MIFFTAFYYIRKGMEMAASYEEMNSCIGKRFFMTKDFLALARHGKSFFRGCNRMKRYSPRVMELFC